MNCIDKKVDFAVVIAVNHANPNGDPLNGNRPRADYNNIGEISDVCLKRKIRNRLIDMGENIFVQSDDKNVDGYGSLSERFSKEIQQKEKKLTKDQTKIAVCQKWFDVRAFGQVFAFKSAEKGVTLGIRGPVSIMPAFSVDIVTSTSTQITKSVNSEPGDGKTSDTMGMKHRVDFGMYVTYGSINCSIAAEPPKGTGFSQEDADKLKEALRTMFRNDSSSARPEGSMEVVKLYWWRHNDSSGQYSSAKVHRSLVVKKKDGVDVPSKASDYEISMDKSLISGLSVEEIDGE